MNEKSTELRMSIQFSSIVIENGKWRTVKSVDVVMTGDSLVQIVDNKDNYLVSPRCHHSFDWPFWVLNGNNCCHYTKSFTIRFYFISWTTFYNTVANGMIATNNTIFCIHVTCICILDATFLFVNVNLCHPYDPELNSAFLRTTAVPAGTAEARISYGNSVCLSVCPSRPGAETTEWDRDSGSSPYDSLESPASNEVILVRLSEEIPLERGHQRGVPPLEIVILPLLAHLAW